MFRPATSLFLAALLVSFSSSPIVHCKPQKGKAAVSKSKVIAVAFGESASLVAALSAIPGLGPVYTYDTLINGKAASDHLQMWADHAEGRQVLDWAKLLANYSVLAANPPAAAFLADALAAFPDAKVVMQAAAPAAAARAALGSPRRAFCGAWAPRLAAALLLPDLSRELALADATAARLGLPPPPLPACGGPLGGMFPVFCTTGEGEDGEQRVAAAAAAAWAEGVRAVVPKGRLLEWDAAAATAGGGGDEGNAAWAALASFLGAAVPSAAGRAGAAASAAAAAAAAAGGDGAWKGWGWRRTLAAAAAWGMLVGPAVLALAAGVWTGYEDGYLAARRRFRPAGGASKPARGGKGA